MASTTVREFDGATGTQVAVSPGALADMLPTPGATSFAFLWKPAALDAHGLLRIEDGSGTGRYTVNPYSDGKIYFATSAFQASPYSYTATDGWRLDAITRAAGFTQTPRWHGYTYVGGTWSHTNGSGTLDDPSASGAVAAVRIGNLNNGSDSLNGRLAAVGIWKRALTDLQVESLAPALQAWVDQGPAGLWAFNQTSIADDVRDLTGGGADETADAGTSVIVGDPPPGFDFAVNASVWTYIHQVFIGG